MAKKNQGLDAVPVLHAASTKADKVFDVVNAIIMIILCVIIVYPLWYVLLASFTDPAVVNSGKMLLIPTNLYFAGYKTAFSFSSLLSGYKNNIIYTVVGTVVSICCTIPGAYALSRKDLVGRRQLLFLFTFTMFFSGGIIPMFITLKTLKLYNTMWALVLPAAISVYNMIVCRSFFESTLPKELLEAAHIDGESDIGFFFKIAIPLSSTIIAVMVLFYATAMWNVFFNAQMFIGDDDKMPLQVVLRNLVLSNQLSQGASGAEAAEKQKLIDQLKYVIITVSAVPLMIVYPFVQKYFAAGVTLGAVKG